ncbi:MAG: bifunctional phosphopantothenoylcysteine decarboxylase/phosphopantothenate--cysteine ligase CoaBC [Clostridiales bacterium]|nr:bifunctional phosphopantothenoylcysteine decarboxylase/phosphopantothenate--cysteine ligase CoaBC [Clostridiales bacterium]
MLNGRTVVLGVTGGIAAYKSCEVVSRLVKAGAHVYVVMTKSACEFVTPLTFETLSRHTVAVDTFACPDAWEVEHIALAKRAEVFLIAPATANVIAKLAHGIADDMLTTTYLATRAPLLLAPAMNTVMWKAEVTQQNLATLLKRGARTVGPEGGALACGDVGAGRMSEPEDIVAACAAMFGSGRDLDGLHVVVTAGPTREALDPVRFLTNCSSGRMGYAIAEAALARGANVTLVSGPVSLATPEGAHVVAVNTTDDLLHAVTEHAQTADILIQAAAPSDFAPLTVAEEKISKRADEGLTLELVQTPDVAAAVGRTKRAGLTFVGFAAETSRDIARAREKLHKKNLDLIALNDVTQPGAGFDVVTNALILITDTQVTQLPMLSKREAADRLLDQVLLLRKGN